MGVSKNFPPGDKGRGALILCCAPASFSSRYGPAFIGYKLFNWLDLDSSVSQPKFFVGQLCDLNKICKDCHHIDTVCILFALEIFRQF